MLSSFSYSSQVLIAAEHVNGVPWKVALSSMQGFGSAHAQCIPDLRTLP